MNPTRKWAWFDQRWLDYTITAGDDVLQIWNEFYKDRFNFSSSPSQDTMVYPLSDNNNNNYNRPNNELLNAEDLYIKYCNMSRVSNQRCKPKELTNWWKDQPQSDLSMMAWDTLAIPAMSAECERIFSSASRLVTSLRESLQDEVIEANECLKNWYTQEKEGGNGTGGL